MKLIVFSDTHGQHRDLDSNLTTILPFSSSSPVVDLAIFCGDITLNGERECIEDFYQWFGQLRARHKVLIAGNHDGFAERNPDAMYQLARQSGVHYLCNSGVTLEGVKIWGSPITPRFMDWSFMADPGSDIARYWNLIPEGTDILITHGPPFGILDELHSSVVSGHRVIRAGCPELSKRVRQLKPAIHLFGHIHEAYGLQHRDGVQFVNASSMSREYVLQNLPVELDIAMTGQHRHPTIDPSVA